MIRVLLVTNIPTPNNEALFTAIAREPDVHFHVAYCAEIEYDRSWILQMDQANYEFSILPGITFRKSFHVNPSVLQVISRQHPDVVVLAGSYAAPTIQLAARVLKSRRIPWIYWGEEIEFREVGWSRRIGRVLLRRILREATGVFAVGRRAATSYERIGVLPSKIARFYYHANTKAFQVDPEKRQRIRANIRETLQINSDTAAFIFCGYLARWKGVDVLLRALAILYRQGGSCIVIIVGTGPDREILEALAVELGILAHIRFVGFVQPSKLPEYFYAADALILPSRREGWGLVVHEALAAGLPVIASDRVNGAVELLSHSSVGSLFPADEPLPLAAAMQALTDSSGEAGSRMATAQAIAEQYSCDRGAARFVRLLQLVTRGVSISELESY